MLSKKILISAVLMFACGSANAFDFGKWGTVGGQLAGTIGGAIGNTSCTSTKCGAANVLPQTVQKCLNNPATIQKNPNCAGAFFHQQCNPGQRNFIQACQTVANTMGFNYQANAQRPQGGRQQVPHGVNAANQRVQQGRQQVQQGRQQLQQQYNQFEDDYIDEGQLGHEDQFQDDLDDNYGNSQDHLNDEYEPGQFDDAEVDDDNEYESGQFDGAEVDYNQEQDEY